MTLINCKYLVDGLCQHKKAPHGKRPHPQKCLRFCKVYEGPERPQFNPLAVSIGESAACVPCAKAAAAKQQARVKHNPAEAARILTEAMNPITPAGPGPGDL